MDRLRCGASKPRARREVGFKKASKVSMWRTIADLSNRTENRALACDVLLIPSPHLWAHVQAILASAPSTTEDSKDEVQTRVYLARWLHAGAEPSRQDADQRIRELSHARSASVVGLRRQLHNASRGGSSSDCVLKPVRVFPDSQRTNGVLVLCEVMMPDGT